jgi:hypothetical protein
MERDTANASYYLPSYDLKRCTQTAAELKSKIEVAQSELVPKRKFAFSKKVNRVKGMELSTAAAETNPIGSVPVSAGGTSVENGLHTADTQNADCHNPEVGHLRITDRDIALVKEGKGLMGLRNQVIVFSSEEISGRDFVRLDLKDCKVYLMGHLPALRLLGLENTTIVAGPITGACFVEGSSNCCIAVASYQVIQSWIMSS